MRLRSYFYRILNRFCRVDITRVLVLDVRAASFVPNNDEINCQWLGANDLDVLTDDIDFQIRQEFVNDFKRLGLRGVSATVDGKVVGILFLMPDRVAARHNSGGSPFKGIGLKLPAGVFYLFKVVVRPGHRGKKINAKMMDFAIEQLGTDAMDTIVTTTDWTNHAFLKSVENHGFTRCGFASELVVAGRHFYQLPKVMTPSVASTDKASSDNQEPVSVRATFLRAERRAIIFTHE